MSLDVIKSYKKYYFYMIIIKQLLNLFKKNINNSNKQILKNKALISLII